MCRVQIFLFIGVFVGGLLIGAVAMRCYRDRCACKMPRRNRPLDEQEDAEAGVDTEQRDTQTPYKQLPHSRSAVQRLERMEGRTSRAGMAERDV